ncbi:MAG: type II toxin-antitoxin system HicB family antitoxin [Planctomycetaceae bacterium]
MAEVVSRIDRRLSRICKSRGEMPDKPFSGQFVTRISPDLHRQVNVAAMRSGKSLNAWVAEQLANAVQHVGETKEISRSKTSKSHRTSPRAKRPSSPK